MLRWMTYCALGAGIVLGGGSLSGRLSSSSVRNAPAPQSGPAAEPVAGSQPTHVKIKVMYFQMPSSVFNRDEEHFVLQAPAYLRDILARVLIEHPPLSPMIPAMMVLVDGVAARPASILNDGDEVDFIPAAAGG